MKTIAALVLLLAITSCNHQNPTPQWVAGQVIDCATEVIRKCAPPLVGPAATCLGNLVEANGGFRDCLAALIPAAECGGEAALACAIRVSRAGAGQATDETSARIRTRADAWVSERGYVFAPEAGGR